MAEPNGTPDGVEPPAREAMEFDIVIVGAGPAGLSAAHPVEAALGRPQHRGARKGVRGRGPTSCPRAVIDPAGLDAAAPRLAPRRRPSPHGRGHRGPVLLSGSRGRHAAAQRPDAETDEQPRQFSSARWPMWRAISAARPRRSGSRSTPASRPSRCSTATRAKWSASPLATWASAATAGSPTAIRAAWNCGPNMCWWPKGARGSLAKGTDPPVSASTPGREPQKYGIGLKELWQVAPGKHQPGLVQHSFGWPLGNSTGGGSFLYGMEDGIVARGLRGPPQLPEPDAVAVRRVPSASRLTR